jgi:hypothetical protein
MADQPLAPADGFILGILPFVSGRNAKGRCGVLDRSPLSVGGSGTNLTED